MLCQNLASCPHYHKVFDPDTAKTTFCECMLTLWHCDAASVALQSFLQDAVPGALTKDAEKQARWMSFRLQHGHKAFCPTNPSEAQQCFHEGETCIVVSTCMTL